MMMRMDSKEIHKTLTIENDTDTLNERSESTELDDTQKDPDFDVEKEEQKNSEVTIIADESNVNVEEENSQVIPNC